MSIIPRWTFEQLAAIQNNATLSDRELVGVVNALGPDRTAEAIKSRRKHAQATTPNIWNDERMVARLVELYAKGLSASQIARLLCGEFEVFLSRNSVIGKIHRLGIVNPERASVTMALSHAPDRAKLRKPPAPAKAARAFQHGSGCDLGSGSKPPMSIKTAGPTPLSLNLPMWADAFGHGCCKWAAGEDEHGHLFCAAPALQGMPYCPAHNTAAYRENPKREPAPVKERVVRADPQDEDEPKPLDFEAAA